MKQMSRNSTQIQHILWIYLMAFVLIAFSFNADAKPEAKVQKMAGVEKKTDKSTTVVIDVDKMGKIEIALNAEKAPISTENFLKYVDEKFYDGTIFHRVIPTFMIQGGGMTPDMKEKSTHPAIKNEAKNGLSNKRGTIAMARTDEIDSATAQFYINVEDNTPGGKVNLDYQSDKQYGYAVFGEVTKGMDVVDKIRNVQTGLRPPHSDVPVKDVLIKSVRRK